MLPAKEVIKGILARSRSDADTGTAHGADGADSSLVRGNRKS